MKKKKIKPEYQTLPNECGTCCIAMILKYYNVPTNISLINIDMELGRDGISILQIKKYLELKQFQVKVYKSSVRGLEKIDLPAIITWKENHYVILEQINADSMVIVDPNSGRKKIEYNQFKMEFGEYVVEIHPNCKRKFKLKEKVKFKLNQMCGISLKELLPIAVISLISYVLTLILPIIIQYITDNVRNLERNNIVLWGTEIYLITYILVQILDGYKKIIFGNKVYQELNKSFVNKILKISYKYFQKYTSGDILYRINALESVERIFTRQIIPIVFESGSVLVLMIYLYYKSVVVFVVISISLICAILILICFLKKNNELIRKSIQENGNLNNILVELVSGMENIKILNMELNIYKKWQKKFEEYNNANLKYHIFSNLYTAIMNTFSMGFPLVILMFIITKNKKYFTWGECMGIYSTVAILYETLVNILSLVNEYFSSVKYIARVKDVFLEKEESNGKYDISKEEKVKIELLNVNFSYGKNSRKILKNISMIAEAGKMIAIVGESGSGKSTVFKILCGLFEAQEGEVRYNGINIKDIDKSKLRVIMGVVPQQIQLFDGDIYSNILLNNNVDQEEVLKICKTIGLDQDIINMPLQYHTTISNNGMGVSGGQRQKIAIARALLTNPKVLLLDEATSHLDTISERKITDELKKRGVTRIVIAHRMSTVKEADYIYVLQDGMIVEEGTHEQLYLKKGKYRKLYNDLRKK